MRFEMTHVVSDKTVKVKRNQKNKRYKHKKKREIKIKKGVDIEFFEDFLRNIIINRKINITL